MRLVTRLTCVALIVVASAPAHAQSSAAPPIDLSGLWLVQDPGSGSWTDWFFNAVSLPKPQLHPSVIAENQMLAELERKGEVVNRAPRRLDCPTGSVAMAMASSPPLNIVQGRQELLMGSEAGRNRIIALDGRALPDMKSSSFVPTGAGYSVGRWEGRTLVVDTIGFATDVCDSRRPSGGPAPGGGRVRQTTKLSERYELDGDTLSVTFTWEDPTVYFTPYTYTYKYKKLPLAEPFEN